MRPLKAQRCQYYSSGGSFVYENFYTSVSKDAHERATAFPFSAVFPLKDAMYAFLYASYKLT